MDGDADIDLTTTSGTLSLSELPERTERLARQAHRLHCGLEHFLGVVDLILTDNRRRMVSSRRRRNRQEIRAHHMFLGCDTETVRAIASLAAGEDWAREHIQGYIQDNRQAIRFEPRADELNPRGEHHRLEVILDAARRHLDDADLDDIQITWGRDGRGRKTIRFGSYDFDQKLIRVHPALDQDWVPRFFIEFIVYHELLHAIFPPVDHQSRRSVHPPEFREMERQFPHYEKAMEWESANIRRILNRK